MKVRTLKGFKAAKKMFGFAASGQGEHLHIPYDTDEQVFHYVIVRNFTIVSDGRDLVAFDSEGDLDAWKEYHRMVNPRIVEAIGKKLTAHLKGRRNVNIEEVRAFLDMNKFNFC